MDTAVDIHVEHSQNGSLLGRIREAKRDSNGSMEFFKTFFAIIFGTIGCTIIIGILLVIPIAMIVIGSINLHKCPIEPYIPIFLIVGGVFKVFDALKDFFLKCRAKCGETTLDENDGLSWLGTLVNIFTMAWFIAGCVWVYRVYQPEYEDATSDQYCDKTLYLFTFWLLTIAYIFGGLILVCICILSAIMACA